MGNNFATIIIYNYMFSVIFSIIGCFITIYMLAMLSQKTGDIYILMKNAKIDNDYRAFIAFIIPILNLLLVAVCCYLVYKYAQYYTGKTDENIIKDLFDREDEYEYEESEEEE